MKKNTIKENKKRSLPNTKNFIIFFSVFFGINMLVILILGAVSGGGAWTDMLFHSGKSTDLFMDFFNSIRDGGSENVYSARNNIYPPFCILIFRIFSKMINPDLVATIFTKRMNLLYDQVCMMIYIIFAVICILTMVRLVETYANIQNNKRPAEGAKIISFLAIISYPIVFCLERGNILILSVIFAMFFMFFKDSENKVIKELSFISLALSAAIKVYPAVFGLTMIIEKRYKEAIRLVVYGIIAVVAPIVFFIDFKPDKAALLPAFGLNTLAITNSSESTSMLLKLLQNVIKFATTKKASYNLSSVSIQNIVFLIGGDTTAAKIVCGITEVIALVAAFITKKEWMRSFLLCYVMLNVPSASSSYALSFLIIPFCMFLFGTSDYRERDWFYTVCFALLLTPLPAIWYYMPKALEFINTNTGLRLNSLLNQNIATFVFQLIFILIFMDIILNDRDNIKKKKKDATVKESEVAVEEA